MGVSVDYAYKYYLRSFVSFQLLKDFSHIINH